MKSHKWPTCGRCQKSALLHRLTGDRLKCDAVMEGTFTAQDVIDVRLALGKSVGHRLLARADHEGGRRSPT